MSPQIPIDPIVRDALFSGANNFNSRIGAMNVAPLLDLRALEFAFGGLHLTNFDGYSFPVEVRFDGLLFPPDFSFRATQFMGQASFRGCQFSHGISFEGCNFNAGALFTNAVFFGNVNFNRTHTPQERTFNADGAIFHGDATFNQATLGNVSFVKAQFRAHTTFKDSTLGAPAAAVNFEEAQFQGPANFQCIFAGDANFERARFRGLTFFSDSLFNMQVSFAEAGFTGNAWFSNVQFQQIATFKKARFIREAFFGDTRGDRHTAPLLFEDTAFLQRAVFDGRTFHWPAHFIRTRFFIPPSFHNAVVHPATDFTDTNFGYVTFRVAEANFRALKQIMSAQQNHRQELIFFADEMRARAFKDRRRRVKVLYAVYDYCSRYGLSIIRPIVGLLATWVGAFQIYVVMVEGIGIILCVFTWRCRFDFDRFNALFGFTLSQSLPFVNLFRDSSAVVLKTLFESAPVPWYVQAVAVVQGFATIGFLFMIALGLRNLFRLN